MQVTKEQLAKVLLTHIVATKAKMSKIREYAQVIQKFDDIRQPDREIANSENLIQL